MKSRRESSAIAPHACAACQQYKRRCDKALPSCSLCVRVKRECKYSGRVTDAALRARIQELESIVSTLTDARLPDSLARREQTDDASPCSSNHSRDPYHPFQKFFLDSECPVGQYAAARRDIHIPATVMNQLGYPDTWAAIMVTHFQTTHQWMPIISKVRLELLAHQESKATQPSPDFVLLLLTMKLVQHMPADGEEAPGHSLYLTAKNFCSALEIEGVASMMKLQASLLIAAYEMGHAIYPAAYMSVGYCVTQALTLGIQNKEAPQLLKSPHSWVEWDERVRVWWQVIIFDCYLTSAGAHRPLLTEKPKMNALLPADDGGWDRGEHVVPERLFLSSPDQLSASPFARLAQASHLLGEVIRHCNSDMSQPTMVLEELNLLHQTICALLDILIKEDASAIRFHSAIAVCLSALMNLSEQHNCDTYNTTRYASNDISNMTVARNISARGQAIIVETTIRALSFIDSIRREMATTDADFSPWLLRCVYQTATVVAWLGPATLKYSDQEYSTARAKCVDVLSQANQKFQAAGVYLEALRDYETPLGLGWPLADPYS